MLHGKPICIAPGTLKRTIVPVNKRFASDGPAATIKDCMPDGFC